MVFGPFSQSSVHIEVLNDSQRVLVGDHALVHALDLVGEDDVDVSSAALLEAGRLDHPVEQLLVHRDVLKFFLRGRRDRASPDARVCLDLRHFYLRLYRIHNQ